MPDGGSQSPITMRLNRIASRRLTNVMLRDALLEKLDRDAPSTIEQIIQASFGGTVIATRPHELQHILRWPPEQLEMLRTVVIRAIEQNRPTFYDWQLDTSTSITVRDDGQGVFITFRSKEDVDP